MKKCDRFIYGFAVASLLLLMTYFIVYFNDTDNIDISEGNSTEISNQELAEMITGLKTDVKALHLSQNQFLEENSISTPLDYLKSIRGNQDEMFKVLVELLESR